MHTSTKWLLGEIAGIGLVITLLNIAGHPQVLALSVAQTAPHRRRNSLSSASADKVEGHVVHWWACKRHNLSDR